VVGRKGAVEIYEPAVSHMERELLMKSAESLKATWAQVKG
jgi:malate/lactate dehydrogenase